MTMRLELTGDGLTAGSLAAASRGPTRVTIADRSWRRMGAARRAVERVLAEEKPVYGLTTGLGARVGERLKGEQLRTFPAQTLSGRAHAVGRPLPRDCVRAAMIVRLNTFLRGAAGVSPPVARHLAAAIDADLVPVVPETGSIGAADLCWMATLSLALMGQGTIETASGEMLPAAEALASAGLAPPGLLPRDGLALANSSSLTAGIAALGVADTAVLVRAMQVSAALGMEAFRANLSPLDPRALALRPQPGQDIAAAGLRHLLDGSGLWQSGAARRLQDPVSLRNVAQTHGAALATLDFARSAAEAEINGASDNPVVVAEDEVISAGGYHTPMLAIACQALASALQQASVLQAARIAKLLSARFTDLPLFLARPGAQSNGFAPVMKIVEALISEIMHLAAAVPVFPSMNADGVEDGLTNAPIAAKALAQVVAKGRLLAAIDLMVAAEAVEQRGVAIAPRLGEALAIVRKAAGPIGDDRPLAADIERLAVDVVAADAFAALLPR